MSIQEIHDKVFDFLLERTKIDKDLRYNLRQTNIGGRLTVDNHWFHTKEGKICLTFWDDWYWPFPTIHFGIDTSKNNQCYLQIFDMNEERVKAITKDLAKSLKLSRLTGQK